MTKSAFVTGGVVTSPSEGIIRPFFPLIIVFYDKIGYNIAIFKQQTLK